MSHTNLLSIIPNRRYLDQCIKETWYDDYRHKTICVMIIDLGNYTKIDDIADHNAADNVLNYISINIDKLLRGSEDYICRISTDEFVLVSYDKNIVYIETIATEILDYFSKISYMTGVTISIGACITSDKSKNIDALLVGADCQIYKSKKEGKQKFTYSYY